MLFRAAAVLIIQRFGLGSNGVFADVGEGPHVLIGLDMGGSENRGRPRSGERTVHPMLLKKEAPDVEIYDIPPSRGPHGPPKPLAWSWEHGRSKP